MGAVAGGGDEVKGRQTALDRELAKGAAWNLGEWGTGEFASPLLDYLLAAVQAPKGPKQAALLEKLSRQPLLVARWVAVPEVRRKVTALGHTPEGRIVLDVVVPILCHFALRLTWDDLAPQPQADLHQLAHALHTRAMRYLLPGLDEVGDDPEGYAGVAEESPKHRALALSEKLDLKRWLGLDWRRRWPIMLGVTPGALRTSRWRRRTVTRLRTSLHRKSRS